MVNIPKVLIAGDSWKWTADYGDFPAPTWDATAYFENAAQSFEVAASASGTSQVFAETAGNTAGLKAGSYYVQVRVTDGGESKTVEASWCDVKTNPAGEAKVDHRSWARRTLDAIEAFLEGNATTAQASVSIGGRTLSRWSLAELMQLRDQLKAEVRTEEQGSQAGLGRDIKVRYGQP
jgi:hypothetical protein